MTKRFALGFGIALLVSATSARAESPSPAATFSRATARIEVGQLDDAIVELEAYADREAAHPDVSYNRGLAYVLRVRNGAERPGDLGRAAAAFEEALELRPDDSEARQALELVRAEIARRRARSGRSVERATPSLDRSFVRLASPRAWSFAAWCASGLLALGIVLRRRSGAAHLTGSLLLPLAAVALLPLVPTALWAAHLDRHRRPGVLVVDEATLTDEHGVRIDGDPIPEGAILELGEVHGDRVRTRYGSREGWVPLEAARPLRVR